MSVNPIPVPNAGVAPALLSDADIDASPVPKPRFTPNPYGTPDRIVSERARTDAHRQIGDYRAAAQQFWNTAIGDDLHAVTDPSQSDAGRLLHAGLAGATILTLPGAPGSFGLKLVAKEMIKGGVEQLTFHATGEAAAKGGKLVIEAGAALKPDEAKLAAEFAGRGHHVIAKTPSRVGKSADFIINGRSTELKTISHVKADSVGEAITQKILGATKQAKHIVIDARNQRGLTEAAARAAVRNAVRESDRSSLGRVHLLGRSGNRSFEFTVIRK